MNYSVCTKYCGSVVELENFDLLEDAENFMKRPCTLFYADEMEDGEEDEVIYPDEMWIEKRLGQLPLEEIPFTDMNPEELEPYDMPF